MVGIVESVEKILVERVDVLQSGEAIEDEGELFRKGLLGELDLARIEIYRGQRLAIKTPCRVFVLAKHHICSWGRTSDSADLKPRADLGGQSALGATQNNVKKFLRCRHRLDILPRCLHGRQFTGGGRGFGGRVVLWYNVVKKGF